MDPLTHALSSYALKRAALARAPRTITFAILIAGTIADLDAFSSSFSPSGYLTFYRTYCHSIVVAILIGVLSAAPFLLFKPKTDKSAVSRSAILIATLTAALVHLFLDLCQSAGVQLLWPFSSTRFALDWLAHVDLWIVCILLAGILLPMLSGLVTEEIGARSKAPRGRLGATLTFVALFLYIGLRFVFHGNAIAALESHTYRGEASRRAAAFPESSPFRWHGLVETERALHDVEVPVVPSAEFDPASAITTYKPEPSPALDAARNSSVARRFLAVARFPKASVEQSPTGYHVILRDFPYNRDASSGLRIQALIDTDPSGKLLSQDLVWIRSSPEFWWK